MRRLLPFIALAFFTSCSVYTPGQYLNPPVNSLSNIPLRPHTSEVDVFFNNEKPGKPYYRVKMVEVQGDPLLSSDQMLKRLQEQAKKEGIDALLITDIGKQSNTTTTLPAGDGVIAYQKLVALGLKYKDRITYMNQILKEQMVNLWPDDNPEPKQFSIHFNLNGQLLPFKDEFTKKFFNNELYCFEDENTVYAPLTNWAYHLDTLNHFFAKKMIENNVTLIQSRFQLVGGDNLGATIKIKKPGTEVFDQFELERYYSSSSALPYERKLRKRKAKTYEWEEEITYRTDGLPDTIKRYRISNGRRLLYFEIENIYHSTNDLPEAEF